MPLYTADALVLRTYKLGEADRIVVFLTRDRGKKRGVAPVGAAAPLRGFVGALEPLTRGAGGLLRERAARAGESQLRRTVRSPMVAAEPRGPRATAPYFAELLDEWAAEADPDERLFRLGHGHARGPGGRRRRSAPLARYFECWLLRLQGVYPADVACAECGTDFATATAPTWRWRGTASSAGRVTALTAPTTASSRRARLPSSAPRGG